MRQPSFVMDWGSTAAERDRSYPCDELVDSPELVMHRAVDVDAPVEVAFRWLCQLRLAPYSYDWIDNRGRRSPRQLVDGVDELEVGQRWQLIFTLRSFEPGHSLTMEITETKAFGAVAVTYEAVATSPSTSRYVVRIITGRSKGARGVVMRTILPAGDCVMMRKQLLTLKRLAQQHRETENSR